MEAWAPATRVQKNDAGEYRALINDQWIAVSRAQKNEAGEFRVMLTNATTTPDEPSFGDRAKRVAGLSARALVKGVAAVPTLMADAASELVNAGAGAVGADYRMQRPSTVLDRDLTRAGLPEPSNAVERVSSDVTGAMAGQAGIAAAGGVMRNAVSPIIKRVGDLFVSKPGLQATTAAAGTTAGSLTRESGGTPTEQLGANLAATLAVPTVAGMVRKNPLPADIQNVMVESKRRDVPLTFADLTGKGRRLDTMLEQAPVVGTSSFRERGAVKATRAMESFADDAKGVMQGAQYRGLERLDAAAAAGDKSARNTLDQIQNAGEDWTKIMQASGNLKLWRAKQGADELYGRVEQLANTKGQVPLTGTNTALDAAIATESASKLPDQALIAKLTEIKTNLANGNDFSAIRQLRSDIGDLVTNYYKGANAAVGAKGVDKLQSVKNAVEGDMEAFATTNGGDLQRAWKRADEFYKTAVVPYKDRALAGALKSDLPDEVYRKFVQVGKSGAGEDRAQKFYNALDPKGRAAVRYGMIANAIDAATIPEKQGLLSPGKFEQSLNNIKSASGVFFKGDDKAELNGFANLMEHARRFGQYTENPPTGQRVIPWLALGGAALEPTAVAGVGTAAWAAKTLITTDRGKNFLLEASSLKAGTPEMQRLVDELSRHLPRLAGSQTTQPGIDTQEQRTPTQ